MDDKKSKIDNNKLNKISHESFKIKHKKLNQWNKEKIRKIKKDYKDNFDKDNRKIIKNKLKKSLLLQRNKYTLKFHYLENQELNRKYVLEKKTSEEKKKLKNKIEKNPYNKKKLRTEFNKKVIAIQKKYSKPVSEKYLAQKNNKEILKEKINFSKINVPLQTPKKRLFNTILLIILAAIITTLALDIFIKSFGIYNAGLRGITQTLFYVIKHYKHDAPNSWSYILFFAANIPLAIFGYFKLGKKITYLTISFIIIQYLFSNLLEITNIEKYLIPFGKTSNEIYQVITSHKDSSSIYLYVLPFVSAVIGGILYGIGVGITYLAGGSTGGSKFIVSYIAAKKDRSIGHVAKYIAIFVLLQGIIINHIIINHEGILQSFSSTILFASITFIFVSNFALDTIFTKSKKDKITILTEKENEILWFIDLYIIHGTKVVFNKVEVGHKKRKKYEIKLIVPKKDASYMIPIFKSIDEHAVITKEGIDETIGKMPEKWFK